MSIESKIYSALTGNTTIFASVSNRIFPMVMPQDTTLPAITYQRLSGGQENDLSGYSNLENPHISIMCWATNYDGALDLAEDVHVAMDGAGSAFHSILVNDLDGFDPETEYYVRSMDFSCWGQTS